MDGCVFCSPSPECIFRGDELAYALWDSFPVTPLHTLIIPRRHAADYFALTREEVLACHEHLGAVKVRVIRAGRLDLVAGASWAKAREAE